MARRKLLIVALLMWPVAVDVHSATLPSLPKLDLTNTFPGVSAQIREANAEAQAHPNDADAVGKLGMALDAYQQYAAAEICYHRAHLLSPSTFSWAYELAYVEMKLGRYRDASAGFRMALKLRADYLPATLNLAECFLSIGQLAESRELFEAISRKYPGNPEAYYGLGRAEVRQGKLEDAALTLEKAIELFPKYGGAQYSLAMVYQKLGQPGKASEHFAVYQKNVTTYPPEVDPLRAAVQQLDQTPLSYLQRGLALEQAGNLAGAIEAHVKATQIDPTFEQPHINLIQLYARTGEYAKAEEQYHIAVRLNPHRPDCDYSYGVLMFGLGKYSEAEEAFRKAIASDPFYAEAHNNLGFLLQRQGRISEALQEYREAVKNEPGYRLARFHIGLILVDRGDYAGAIKQLRMILEPDDAETPTYLYTLATTYVRAGDFTNALAYMRKARTDAAAKDQPQLLPGIDRDLRALESDAGRR